LPGDAVSRHERDFWKAVMEKFVVLLSGGMDSAALLHYVKKSLRIPAVYSLSFNYGQKHSREIQMAKWQAESVGVKEHREIDISFFAELTAGSTAITDPVMAVPDVTDLNHDQRRQPPTYVPNRNMVFLSLAASYAEALGARKVCYGAQMQDDCGYWDCTADFVDSMNRVLNLNRGKPVTVYAPFAGMRKVEVLKIGLELAVDYSHTWTCYRGGAVACGTCASCVERSRAFQEAGVPDTQGSSGTLPGSGGQTREKEQMARCRKTRL